MTIDVLIKELNKLMNFKQRTIRIVLVSFIIVSLLLVIFGNFFFIYESNYLPVLVFLVIMEWITLFEVLSII